MARSLEARLREGVTLLLRANETLTDWCGEKGIINGPEAFRPDVISSRSRQINVCNDITDTEEYRPGVGDRTNDFEASIHLHYWEDSNDSAIPLVMGETGGALHWIAEIARTIVAGADGNGHGKIIDPDAAIDAPPTIKYLNQHFRIVRRQALIDPKTNMTIWRLSVVFVTRINDQLNRA